MDELTIIKGKVLLDTTYLKIKISLEEIKQNLLRKQFRNYEKNA